MARFRRRFVASSFSGVIVFASFGLCAPRNSMVIIALALCALSLTSAMFVILDLDLPHGGLFGISSQSMRDARSMR